MELVVKGLYSLKYIGMELPLYFRQCGVREPSGLTDQGLLLSFNFFHMVAVRIIFTLSGEYTTKGNSLEYTNILPLLQRHNLAKFPYISYIFKALPSGLVGFSTRQISGI